MRTYMGTLAVLGLGSMALAQSTGQPVNLNPAGQQNPNAQAPAPAPVKLDPANNRLDALLLQWEQKMKGINQLSVTVSRTDTEIDLGQKTVKAFRGVVKILRPNRVYMHLQKADDKNIYELYVYTGTYLYEFRPQTKLLRIHELNPKPGQVVEDNFLNFLFGMKADEAKKRYELTLVKEDEHYYYIFVVPKFAADLADFSKARLVLFKNSFLPRQFETESTNQRAFTKWDIEKFDAETKLSAADLNPPEKPKDWRLEKVLPQTPGVNPLPNTPPATEPPPTKVRPNGG